MKKHIIWFLLILLVLPGCTTRKLVHTVTQQSFRFDTFKIDKECIGSIKLGMTVSEAERFLSGFNKEVS